MKHILVFAPHPDDEVIGCGGQICKHTAKGDQITVVFMTNGEAGDLEIPAQDLAATRRAEAQSACKVLGVKTLLWLGLPDGAVHYESDTVSKIAQIIREQTPDVIYSPHAQDAHTDHQAAYLLIKEAINRAASHAFPLAETRPWQTASWLCYEIWTPLTRPQFCTSIDAHIDTKLAALREYRSQLKNVAYDEAIKGLNTYRGAMSGKGKSAECFTVERISELV